MSPSERANPFAEQFAAAYGELRRIAHAQLYRSGSAFSTTELVHESFLRFANLYTCDLGTKRQFLAYAAKVMRSVVVDAARARLADQRGGDVSHTQLNSHIVAQVNTGPGVLAIEDAMRLLEKADPRLAEIVELRFYAGLSVDEAAEVLGVSSRALAREWAKARLILLDAVQAR
jgi:RNA polymerase sigma factor (TIGR02999 family)